MNKYLVALVASLALATVAFAKDAPKGPVTMANKQGAITFDHKNHAATKCEACHGADGAGKAFKGKEGGHATCLECHKTSKDKGAKADCKSCHSGAKAA